MTINADDVSHQAGAVQNPQALFEKAKMWMTSIKNTELDETKTQLILHELHETMIRAIFGSNQIERAGLSLDLRIDLCRKVFAGDQVGDPPERDPTHQSQLLELYSKQPDLQIMQLDVISCSPNGMIVLAAGLMCGCRK
jgi:hypothetical protein